MVCAGGTSVHGHPEGETRECNRTVRPRLTGKLLMLRDEGGRCSSATWTLAVKRRSKVAASASVRQSRNTEGGHRAFSEYNDVAQAQ